MPADIRSFFGGKSSQGSNSSPAKAPAKKAVGWRFFARDHCLVFLLTCY